MRRADSYNQALFSTVRLEDFVHATHPSRSIRKWLLASGAVYCSTTESMLAHEGGSVDRYFNCVLAGR